MIYKQFQLVNRRWLVRHVTTKQLQKHLDKHPCEGEENAAKDMKGLCDPEVYRIFINKDLHTTVEDKEHTFWHEFVHALKYANGEDGHCEEEVDRLGGFLSQFEQTRE